MADNKKQYREAVRAEYMDKVKYFLEGTMKDRLPEFAKPAKKVKVEEPKQEDDIPF